MSNQALNYDLTSEFERRLREISLEVEPGVGKRSGHERDAAVVCGAGTRRCRGGRRVCRPRWTPAHPRVPSETVHLHRSRCRSASQRI